MTEIEELARCGSDVTVSIPAVASFTLSLKDNEGLWIKRIILSDTSTPSEWIHPFEGGSVRELFEAHVPGFKWANPKIKLIFNRWRWFPSFSMPEVDTVDVHRVENVPFLNTHRCFPNLETLSVSYVGFFRALRFGVIVNNTVGSSEVMCSGGEIGACISTTYVGIPSGLEPRLQKMKARETSKVSPSVSLGAEENVDAIVSKDKGDDFKVVYPECCIWSIEKRKTPIVPVLNMDYMSRDLMAHNTIKSTFELLYMSRDLMAHNTIKSTFELLGREQSKEYKQTIHQTIHRVLLWEVDGEFSKDAPAYKWKGPCFSFGENFMEPIDPDLFEISVEWRLPQEVAILFKAGPFYSGKKIWSFSPDADSNQGAEELMTRWALEKWSRQVNLEPNLKAAITEMLSFLPDADSNQDWAKEIMTLLALEEWNRQVNLKPNLKAAITEGKRDAHEDEPSGSGEGGGLASQSPSEELSSASLSQPASNTAVPPAQAQQAGGSSESSYQYDYDFLPYWHYS